MPVTLALGSESQSITVESVAPLLDTADSRLQTTLPQNQIYWNNRRVRGANTVTVEAPLNTLPLYVKAGAILPVSPVLQHTGEFDRNTVTLRVYPGADGRFTWYDDDGVSYEHESGMFM